MSGAARCNREGIMIQEKDALGLIFFPAYDWAISPTHPEREERLLYTQDQLEEEGIGDIDGITEYRPDLATFDDIARTHFCFPDVASVITDSHTISAGGAIRAARLVMEGESKRSFALVRPPGHHANKSVHGNRGFCNINNEAIMIEFLREHYGVKRVAIVDTDCHHGDGTQDIYWYDPDVLFISLHQDGRTLYPGSGHVTEYGGGAGKGKTINIPLPPGTSDDGFLYALEEMVLPILEDFKPDIIVNSAGQDNHYSDPITNMNFSAQGYARLNEILAPDIAVLEGGYSIHGALPYVNLGIILAMAGLDYSGVVEPDYEPARLKESRDIMDYVKRLKEPVLANYFGHRGYEQEISESVEERSKNVFYDTDGMSESQRERIHTCRTCRGVREIVTQSDRVPRSIGIEIPVGACENCISRGEALYEEAKKSKQYRYVRFIHRPAKRYE